jgi:diacylglycerol kinase family enzyme
VARRIRKQLERRGIAAHVLICHDLPSLRRWTATCEPTFSHLVCVGGDATLSAAAAAAARLQIPFVPVPNGFGNLFARVFGHSTRVSDVMRLLDQGEVHRVDFGRAGQEIFLSHRSYGFLDQVQEAVEEGRRQPRTRGRRHLAYYAMAWSLLFRTPLEKIQLEVDGARVVDDAVLVTVANVETYHGFLSLTPAASPVDGRLDVFVIPRTSKLGLGWRLARIFLRLPGRWTGVALYRGRRVAVTVRGRRDEICAERRALPMLLLPGTIERLQQRAVEQEVPVTSVA